MKFYTAQQSQALDRYAIEKKGIPGILLMKRAAFFALDTLRETWPNAQKIHIVCGIGNNGGDGFILAQLAYIAGYEVSLSQLGATYKIKGDALTALHELVDVGLNPYPLTEKSLQEADVIVDAILGTGLNQPVKSDFAEAFKLINQTQKPILALDLPSGLHANTGAILGTAIQANHTCTFITQKPGLYTFKGPETAGKIHFSPLFLPELVFQTQMPIAQNHSLKYWLNQLPERQASDHKGTYGTALLIGGNYGMMGAIQLAATAGLKLGAGLVKVISQTEHQLALTQAQPELMVSDKNDLPHQLKKATALAIGPGLGQDKWSLSLLNTVIKSTLPMVLDADALNLLSQQENQAESIKKNHWILTPHPAEAARLLGCKTSDIQTNRLQAIQQLQQKYGGIIILKGNGTLIYDGQQMELCTAGNAGMAVGGMGDVLTGMIVSLLAQGMPLFSAANLAVSLHAHAGDAINTQNSPQSILPSDIIQTASYLLNYQTKRALG